MDAALSLALADAAALGRARGRAVARVVLRGPALPRDGMELALAAAGLRGVEVELRAGDGTLRVVAVELVSRADALGEVSEFSRTRE